MSELDLALGLLIFEFSVSSKRNVAIEGENNKEDFRWKVWIENLVRQIWEENKLYFNYNWLVE